MKNILAFFIFSFFSLQAISQQITYSQPDPNDTRTLDFDIIGKLDNHYLVYKHIHSTYAIAVYDNDMKLVDKVKMDFVPDKLINSDIITYKDFFYFIFAV
jgi:hypothetical protein